MLHTWQNLSATYNNSDQQCRLLLASRDGVRTESGPKKSGFSQKIKVRTLRTKVRTLTDLKNGTKGQYSNLNVVKCIA